MKIAFLHENNNEFNTFLLRELRERLSSHEILSWIAGEPAPSNDLDILVANSSVRREQLLDQRKLALIQTATTGYETVDIDAATSMGIWVSYAPSDTTGNATSVAEFAILLLLGAARQIGQRCLCGNEWIWGRRSFTGWLALALATSRWPERRIGVTSLRRDGRRQPLRMG
jgi:phosphoglycerate dehydrogenase-like enzyme